MESEALEGRKPEEEAPIEGKAEKEKEATAEEEVEDNKGQQEEEKVEEVKEEEEEVKQEAKPKKAAKQGGRKGGASKKEPSESDKSKQDSAEEKPGEEESEKKETEPVTPASDRPTRERKIVERYSAPEPGRSAAKPLSIEKGSGTQLKDIPNVAFKLSKRKLDDNLQMLHTILFGKKAKAHNLKKNIGQFSGYVWAENEEKQKAKVREKLDKCVKEKLVDFCDVLNIPINKATVRKEELTVKILEFLESPNATTDVLLAEKEQKSKKRKVSAGKNVSPKETSVSPAKKQRQTPQAGKKRKQSPKDEEDEDEDKVELTNAKDESQDEEEKEAPHKEESDHEDVKSEEDIDEPKEQTPTKKSSAKKTVKESSVVKSKEKYTPEKKRSPAKPAKHSSKPNKMSSGLSSKQDTKDNDGNCSSLSKSKGTSYKKPKVEKEGPKGRSVPSKDKVVGKSSAKSSGKDQGKAKYIKMETAEPSRGEMHNVVVEILKEVDFNTATLSDILRQLGTHFGIDLMHRKAEVKAIITEVINNMSEEEDERVEDEDNAEAGDDADKDGDQEDSDG